MGSKGIILFNHMVSDNVEPGPVDCLNSKVTGVVGNSDVNPISTDVITAVVAIRIGKTYTV